MLATLVPMAARRAMATSETSTKRMLYSARDWPCRGIEEGQSARLSRRTTQKGAGRADPRASVTPARHAVLHCSALRAVGLARRANSWRNGRRHSQALELVSEAFAGRTGGCIACSERWAKGALHTAGSCPTWQSPASVGPLHNADTESSVGRCRSSLGVRAPSISLSCRSCSALMSRR